MLIGVALREFLDRERPGWDPAYLAGEHLSEADLAELRAGADAFFEGIVAARSPGREPPF